MQCCHFWFLVIQVQWSEIRSLQLQHIRRNPSTKHTCIFADIPTTTHEKCPRLTALRPRGPNVHVYAYMHVHVHICMYVYMCIYTLWLLHWNGCGVGEGKGWQKKGCACTCTCSVYCPHTLCMCIHIFCTVLCHATHTNLYTIKISCLHALCVHVVLYEWCVSYYTCLSSHRMETLHWWEQPTWVGLKWLWSWWRQGHCWTCRIQYVPTQLYMMYRNMHTLLLYILKLK